MIRISMEALSYVWLWLVGYLPRLLHGLGFCEGGHNIQGGGVFGLQGLFNTIYEYDVGTMLIQLGILSSLGGEQKILILQLVLGRSVIGPLFAIAVYGLKGYK